MSILRNPYLYVRAGVLAASASVLFLTGCALETTSPEGNSFVTSATITGRVHGGQQPVAGSTVDLYAVGTTGYGTGATRLATTTSANGTGGFTFTQVTTQTGASNPVSATYGCPANTTLLYLVASGGDSTGTGTAGNANSNIRLIDAIGACSAVKTGFYSINEVSTAVTVAALQNYISPLNDVSIGVPTVTGSGATAASAMTGLTNAFALVQSLLNQGAGQVNTTFSPSGSVVAVTATPEVAKFNTIADVLAACVNQIGSGSTSCTTLFSAATPPQVPRATLYASSYNPAPTATETLQAALFMLQNPTDAGTQVTSCSFGTATTNIGCLYNAQTASAPFVGLTAAPADWTVGVTYSASATNTISSTTVGYLNYPQYLGVDKSGNVWVTNGVTGNGGSLVELSPQGAILQQVLATPGTLNGPHVPVIDPSGNVWVPNYGSSSTSTSNTLGYGTTVVEFPLNGTASTQNTYTVGGCPTELASDGAGAIYVLECTVAGGSPAGNTTAGADVRKIPAGAASGSTATVLYTSGSGFSATQYSGIGIDSNFNLWTTSGAKSPASIYSFASPYSSFVSTSTGLTQPEPLAIDHANDAWAANYSGTANAGTLSEVALSSGAVSNTSGSPYTSGGGLATAEFLALDGAGNVWVTNYTSGAGFVSEAAGTNVTATNGTALSPSVGFLHTYYGAYGIAIDPSGNVWVGNNVAATHAAIAASNTGGGAGAGGFLTQIIGAAVPLVTPIAAGLPTTAGGTSTLASPPQ